MLEEILNKYNLVYIPLDQKRYQIVTDLYVNDKMFVPIDTTEMIYMASYYGIIKGNVEKQIEYLSLATIRKNGRASLCLAKTFQKKKDFEKAIKFSVLAIDYGYFDAIHTLRELCSKSNPEKYEHYLKHCAKSGHVGSMQWLLQHFITKKDSSAVFQTWVDYYPDLIEHVKEWAWTNPIVYMLNSLTLPLDFPTENIVATVLETFPFESKQNGPSLSLGMVGLLQKTIQKKHQLLAKILYHYKKTVGFKN